MNLLIISDFITNAIYSQVEEGSVGYYSNISLSKMDASVIEASELESYVLSLITDDYGLSKILFAKITKFEETNGTYKISYIVESTITDSKEVDNFNRAFPFAFKSVSDAKLTKSVDLIDITKFLVKRPSKHVSLHCSTKNMIVNSDAYRLQSMKSEVFKKDNKLGYHSKLSHSVRVNCIADVIARRLEERYKVSIDYELLDNISMALNIGHTPFSYIGERTLNQLLEGKDNIIKNADMLQLKYHTHNFQAVRILDIVDTVCKYNENSLDIEVVAGIISQTKYRNFRDLFKTKEHFVQYLNKYYLSRASNLGEYFDFIEGRIISKNLEAQIVELSEIISQKTYDVELAVKSDAVANEEIKTRLRLLSEVTGEYVSYSYNNKNDAEYASRIVSEFLTDYLIQSVCNSFIYEKYRARENNIFQYVSFCETGKIVLDVIDNYFQSKLLLLRSVRIHDHKAKIIIKDVFSQIYSDINLLPKYYKNNIIEDFKRHGISDLNIILCFISYFDGDHYIKELLQKDLRTVKNKKEQLLLIRKREIIIQVIIDYITMFSDYEIERLYHELKADM